jgi:hypothetical protein
MKLLVLAGRYAKDAFDDRALVKEVAESKGKVFRTRDSAGTPVTVAD